MQAFSRSCRRQTPPPVARRGSILALSTFLLIVAFALAAFAIDLGFITASRAELQKTADAAALAALIELGEGYGVGSTLTPAQVDAAARRAVVDVAAVNRAAGRTSVYADGTRDVRLGQYVWNPDTGTWEKVWGQAPYTLVEVTLHRDQPGSTNGDSPLSLYFAPVIGSRQANLVAQSTTALIPGAGVRVPPGSGRAADVLPIALDLGSWDELMAGGGLDLFRFDPQTGAISSGSDGVREINIYPTGSQNLPPGNRGTVDFGSSNNSTADLSRQIRYGLNEADLSHFGGKLSFENGPLIINGDTGISAGIKDDLEAIKGQPRLMPLFTTVSGPGNNAMYTIVKFVGVRIVYVKLTGKPSSKAVIVQPAPFVSDVVIPGSTTIQKDSYFFPGGLVK
jgi:hypothetical protein